MNDEFETGVVIDLEGDVATVELSENEHCHNCGARLICRPAESGKRIIKLKNRLNAQPGDRIFIEQSDKQQLQLACMQYGLPLLAFILGILISGSIIKASLLGIPKEVWQFLVALCFVLLAGLGTRRWANRKALTDFAVFRMRSVCKE
ncbi:MAG: SoxR reducing system RseC family protein [Fidelibacterota bacterium]